MTETEIERHTEMYLGRQRQSKRQTETHTERQTKRDERD